MRTQTRRMEATLDALSLDSKRNERKLLRRLGQIRKRGGKVRDMDVLTPDLTTIRMDEDRDCVVQLSEYLGAKRYKHAARLLGIIQKNAPVIRKRLKRTSSRIEELVDKNDRSALQREAVAKAMALALTLASELEMPAILNRGNLHAYRLKVKELRYVLQMTANAEHEKFVETLGKAKDAIGEWHDWEEVIAISTKVLDFQPNSPLLRELRAISERKYEFALSITNKMRKDYLNAFNRNAKRRTSGKKRPAEPAIKAVSIIAA